MKFKLVIFLLAVLLVLADQSSKLLATRLLSYGQPVAILPVFDLMLVHNSGAAFSLFADLGWQRWFLVGVSLLASLVLIGMLIWAKQVDKWQQLALGLILSGAVGNLIDRFLLGYVIDFLSWHYHGYYFPTFNVADASISVGATVWIASLIFGRRKAS